MEIDIKYLESLIEHLSPSLQEKVRATIEYERSKARINQRRRHKAGKVVQIYFSLSYAEKILKNLKSDEIKQELKALLDKEHLRFKKIDMERKLSRANLNPKKEIARTERTNNIFDRDLENKISIYYLEKMKPLIERRKRRMFYSCRDEFVSNVLFRFSNSLRLDFDLWNQKSERCLAIFNRIIKYSYFDALKIYYRSIFIRSHLNYG
jgi:hypothetical protein